MRIAMHDARWPVWRASGCQPLREVLYRQRLRLIAVVPITLQQPQKLRNLALQKRSRPFELRKGLALPCDVAQLREAGRIRKPHLMPPVGAPDVRLVHAVPGVEAV